MEEWQKRTWALIGEQGCLMLKGARIAVLGLGGVGGSAAEALARAGVGSLMVADKDCFDESNINRQLLATTATLGMEKPQAAVERLMLINPKANITAASEFYLPENRDFLFEYAPDFVLDAIDNVTAKLDLAEQCLQRGIPLISCMGTGNRLDPTKLTVGDISETAGSGCPLARVMRRELRKRGVDSLKVVFSLEMPRTVVADSENGRHSPASISFVPPVAGYAMASAAVRQLLSI